MRDAAPRSLPDRIEIRLLGPLQLRRADGTRVQPREWRTTKALDLLRLLALRAGDPVPIGVLLDSLWPAADDARARASLRTATSEIRRVVGPASVERELGGLVLRGAWVDAAAYRALAAEARTCLREGMLSRVVAASREAEALYLDDFHSHDDNDGWATEARESLVSTRRELVLDAADAAVELGWMRDAVEFSQHALRLEPSSERACRSLMRGYAGLGETERAMRAYARCRDSLAEEFGVDPSPQTTAVYVELLSAEPVALEPVPFVARGDDERRLTALLAAAWDRREPLLVRVSGDDGSGRRRLLREAAGRAGGRCVALTDASDVPDAGGLDGHVLVTVELANDPDAGPLTRLLDAVSAAGGVAVALVLPQATRPVDRGDAGVAGIAGGGWRQVHLALAPLTAEELAELVRAVLHGPGSRQLVEELAAASGGNVARAVQALRGWSRSGRVTSTAHGLVLAPATLAEDRGTTERSLLTRAVEQLKPDELEVLHVTSLFERPVLPALLVPLVTAAVVTGPAAAAWVQAVLDQLVDLSLLTVGATGYRFRHPLVRDTVASWLRPTARRRMHRRIAEEALIPAAERVRHWQDAGEPQLACAAALDAAREAVAEGRDAEARGHLLQVLSMVSILGGDVGEQARLYGELGDVCLRLGRPEEAREAYALAMRGSEDGAVRPPLGHRTPTSGVLARLEQVEQVLIPGRLVEQSRRVLSEVLTMSSDVTVRTRALLAGHLLDVLLGNARHVAAPLDRLRDGAPDGLDPELVARADLLRALVAHDLGDAAFADLWTTARLQHHGRRDWAWIAPRVLVERGALDQAGEVERDSRQDGGTPLARLLRRLAVARLREASGHADDALVLLRAAADDAATWGCSLVLPEVGARLVMLEAGVDPQAAREHFDLIDWAVGSEPDSGRDRALRLLARAAVRAAAGDLARAAGSAHSAAGIAADRGLVLLAGQAHLARARYLAADGRPAEAAVAQTAAARCFGAAGLAAAAPVRT